MGTHPRLWASSTFLLLGLFAFTGAPSVLRAQTAAAAPAAKPASSNTASGFSIETEMLTYRALESNGEAIACDVAGYLYDSKADFSGQPAGECNVTNTSGRKVSVVVLPFDRNVFSDFELWRSDMQTMAEFEARGASACNAPPKTAEAKPSNQPEMPRGRGLTATATTAANMFTPAGTAVSTAAGVLGLFAHSQEASPVGGTIEDQAFMDNVSRELRAANVSVLMPTVYTPYELTSIDPARSPFVTALAKVMQIRDCLARDKSASDPDITVIKDFIDELAGTPTTPTPSKSAGPSGMGGGIGGDGGFGGGSGIGSNNSSSSSSAAAKPAPPARSHLEADLSADGLAQRLGADPATGQIPASAPQHLLMVKALESGGSVSRSTSIFGSKMSYSGGSVGTFALFALNGDLECSGNVYDYAGYLSAKDFQKQLRAYTPDPGAQVIFQRGGCRKP